MRKKLLSMVLVFSLCLAFLPSGAWADDEPNAVKLAVHAAGNLQSEIEGGMSAKGIATYSAITNLTISGGALNNTDRLFLYNSGLSQSLTKLDLSNTSINYTGAIGLGHQSASNPDELPSYAFGNWTALTSIKLPNSVTLISNWTFSNCPALRELYLPSGLQTIDDTAFSFSPTGTQSLLTDVYSSSTTPPSPFQLNAFQYAAPGAVLHVPEGSGSSWDAKDIIDKDGKLYQLRIENMAPILSIWPVRISNTEATINVISNEPGTCYYKVAADGSTNSAIDVSGSGIVFDSSNQLDINLSGLEATPFDIYVTAVDTLGNMSTPVKIDLEAYIEPVDIVITGHTTGNLGDELSGKLGLLGLTARYDKIKSLKVSGQSLDTHDWFMFRYGMDHVAQSVDLSGTSALTIPENEFSGFSKLTAVSLPDGITEIKEKAFQNCTGLLDLTVQTTSPPAVGSEAFNGIPAKAVVHVPAGSKALYRAVNDGNTTDGLWYGFTIAETSSSSPGTDSGSGSSHRTTSPSQSTGSSINVEKPGATIPFHDVGTGSWYYDSVKYIYEKGLMSGTDTASFNPSGHMTRGMIATILLRLDGSSDSFANPFGDVASGSWYERAAAWAAANNIIRGTGGQSFSPDGELSRQQLAVMLYNYARYKSYDVALSDSDPLNGYTDQHIVSSWAKEGMKWAVNAGLISGDGTYLRPDASITRAEAAAILQRFMSKIGKN